jgi:restriction system protein
MALGGCLKAIALLNLTMPSSDLPSNADLIPLVISALKALGGQGSNNQIRVEIINSMNLSPEVVNRIHSGTRTELEYKLAWARTLAKQKGLIISVGRMTWKINHLG